MRRRFRLGVLAVVGAVVLFGLGTLVSWWYWGRGQEADPALLFDRTWMTPAPERETDFFHAFVVSRDQGLGAFYKASMFRLEEELFEHEHDARTLRLHFPQTGRNARVRYTVRTCDDLPPFTLCLELDRNPWDGPTQYYAFDDDEEATRYPAIYRFLRRTSDLLDR